MLPGGVIRLAAGDEAVISKDVYRRVFRRAATWMVNVDSEIIRANAAEVGAAAEGMPAEAEAPASTDEEAACADAPCACAAKPWTHTYKGLRARVAADENTEGSDRVIVECEEGPNRSLLRTTWEKQAKVLPSPDPVAEETSDDATQ